MARLTLPYAYAVRLITHSTKMQKIKKSLKSLLKNFKNKNAFLRLFHTKVGQMFIYFIFLKFFYEREIY
jgi:hypothetical protein